MGLAGFILNSIPDSGSLPLPIKSDLRKKGGKVEELLKDSDRGFIIILSGNGKGRLRNAEWFFGRRTARAIQMKLIRERRSGEKRVKALLYRRDLECEPVSIDLETGKPYPWPVRKNR
jgi:hypothetical protein